MGINGVSNNGLSIPR